MTKGLADLKLGLCSEESLMVTIASPEFRRLGFEIEDLNTRADSLEMLLYEMIASRCPEGAHAAYNALQHQIVSFSNSYRHA